MFTGIIKNIGKIVGVEQEGTNVHFTVESDLTSELSIDQSVAHNGVCLTVVAIKDNTYVVTAVQETLKKTNLGTWKVGDFVNLELAMLAHARLDGHFVQGHVDTVATCIDKTELDGSHLFTFEFPKEFAALVIEKGSICIDGVSLTVFNVTQNTFSVTIIPYTYEHTGFCRINVSQQVNIEFDIIGKYLLRQHQLTNA